MSHLLDILVQPRKALSDLQAKPTSLLPITVVCIFSTVTTAFYFTKVDPSWLIDHMLAASGSDMGPGQLVDARKAMPSAGVIGYVSAAFAAFASVGMCLLYALYLLIAGRVLGRDTSFSQSLSLAAWASMPQTVGSITCIIAIALMEPQTALESVMLTNMDPLLIELPQDHRWGTLARSFSLLMLWSILLVAMGWRIGGRSTWLQGLGVAALPALLIYGSMATFAMLK